MSPEIATTAQTGSFPRSVTLFRYRGVPVRLDWSWAIIALVAGWLFHGVLEGGRTAMSAGMAATVAAAVATTLLFFASILVHELGHAHTSLDRGLPVRSVTLFLLGGVTESTREAERARDEFVIVGAGPLLSLTLAGVFGLAWQLAPAASPVASVVGVVAVANLVLGLVNLVPGFPLDGGRLLRAILWGATRRPHAATRWAARVGQGFALALGAAGVWFLFGDGSFGGIWELLIALFLYRGAADAHRQAKAREQFVGRTAGQLMGSVPEALDPEQPLHLAVRVLQTKPSVLWPVGSPMTGAVRLADLERVDRSEWSMTPVREVAAPASAVTVAAAATMDDVVDRLREAPGQMLVVVDDDGHAAGLLTPSLVMGNPAG